MERHFTRIKPGKKLILVSVITTLLFSGCTKNSFLPMKYTDNKKTASYAADWDQETETAGFFADNLCVIPLNGQSKKAADLPVSSALLVNITEKKMLYANQIYKRLYPASITKIATALVALKYANMDDIVTFSKKASNITESGAKLCGFKEGDKVRMGDLLTALLVYSGNDAGIAIAEHIAGTEEAFTDMMNREMKNLGTVGTNFVNAHGLHNDKHYTTAYDLYLVFNALIQQKEFVSMTALSEYTCNYKTADGKKASKIFQNTNRFLLGTQDTPDGVAVIGGKTGTTLKAGCCLILYSKDEEDNAYISLILKSATSDSLYKEMASLLERIHD